MNPAEFTFVPQALHPTGWPWAPTVWDEYEGPASAPESIESPPAIRQRIGSGHGSCSHGRADNENAAFHDPAIIREESHAGTIVVQAAAKKTAGALIESS